MLDMIVCALSPALASTGGSYVRIDGSSTLRHRRHALNRYNVDISCRIMLATIGAVGEGLVLPNVIY